MDTELKIDRSFIDEHILYNLDLKFDNIDSSNYDKELPLFFNYIKSNYSEISKNLYSFYIYKIFKTYSFDEISIFLDKINSMDSEIIKGSIDSYMVQKLIDKIPTKFYFASITVDNKDFLGLIQQITEIDPENIKNIFSTDIINKIFEKFYDKGISKLMEQIRLIDPEIAKEFIPKAFGKCRVIEIPELIKQIILIDPEIAKEFIPKAFNSCAKSFECLTNLTDILKEKNVVFDEKILESIFNYMRNDYHSSKCFDNFYKSISNSNITLNSEAYKTILSECSKNNTISFFNELCEKNPELKNNIDVIISVISNCNSSDILYFFEKIGEENSELVRNKDIIANVFKFCSEEDILPFFERIKLIDFELVKNSNIGFAIFDNCATIKYLDEQGQSIWLMNEGYDDSNIIPYIVHGIPKFYELLKDINPYLQQNPDILRIGESCYGEFEQNSVSLEYFSYEEKLNYAKEYIEKIFQQDNLNIPLSMKHIKRIDDDLGTNLASNYIEQAINKCDSIDVPELMEQIMLISPENTKTDIDKFINKCIDYKIPNLFSVIDDSLKKDPEIIDKFINKCHTTYLSNLYKQFTSKHVIYLLNKDDKNEVKVQLNNIKKFCNEEVLNNQKVQKLIQELSKTDELRIDKQTELKEKNSSDFVF